MHHDPPPRSDARAAAPGTLRLVQSFLNTRDAGVRDDFDSREQARRWLARQRLLASGETFSDGDRDRLVRFRDALRSLVSANGGVTPDASATRTLDRALMTMRLRVRLVRSEGYLLVSEGTGVDRVIGDLLIPVVVSMTQGEWRRLKTCRNDACRWAFYDASRNRSAVWCSMATCGNRAKGRAYRARQSIVRSGHAVPAHRRTGRPDTPG